MDSSFSVAACGQLAVVLEVVVLEVVVHEQLAVVLEELEHHADICTVHPMCTADGASDTSGGEHSCDSRKGLAQIRIQKGRGLH